MNCPVCGQQLRETTKYGGKYHLLRCRRSCYARETEGNKHKLIMKHRKNLTVNWTRIAWDQDETPEMARARIMLEHAYAEYLKFLRARSEE